MENKNNNKKIIAEIEVRIGLKVYKLEVNSHLRWLWVLGIILLRIVYEYLRGLF